MNVLSTNLVTKNQLVLSGTNFVTLRHVETQKEILWKAFGRWFQLEREGANLTQEDVAKKTGLHEKSVSRIENGEATKRDTVIKLAEAVGINETIALDKAGFGTPSDIYEITRGLTVNFTKEFYSENEKQQILEMLKIFAAGIHYLREDTGKVRSNDGKPVRAEDDPELAKRKGIFPSGKNRNSPE